ncbi:hypothetical protein ISS40_02605 [Candidatus Bathyarchaeota archaeon]|nr:hypothetical protein [Candidatus Bathyarchaeota archaeon]
MSRTGRRRADIEDLIRVTTKAASRKGKQIRTVDPLVICANRMYPYLPEATIWEYARTALKIITNGTPNPPAAQTTLLTHLA